MPWNGSGTYNLPPAYTPEVNGTVIDATRYNGTTSDVATGITACLAKNGENSATGNISMGGWKLTNVADATAAGDVVALGTTVMWVDAGSAAAPSYAITGDLNTGMYSSAADTLDWSLGGTRQMNLSSTGLGIGGAAEAKLSLVAGADGGIWIRQASANQTGFLHFRDSDSSAGGYLSYDHSSNLFRIATADTYRVYINGSGEFGFNTAAVSGSIFRWESAGNDDVGLDLLRSSATELFLRAYNLATTTYRTLTLGGDTISVAPGGTTRYSFGTSSLFPATTNTYNLGGTGAEWQTVYTRGISRDSAGTLTIGSNDATGTIDLRCAGGSGLFITADRRVYGSALHNNAGAVTGTSNQYIASGTYTPTLTSVANVSSTTARQCQWLRVGNVVTVSGQFDFTPTTTGTINTEVGCSLPIASNFTTAFALGGAGIKFQSGAGFTGEAYYVEADATNDRARFRTMTTSASGSQTCSFSFIYEIL